MIKIVRFILVQVLISSFYGCFSQTLVCNQSAFDSVYYICPSEQLIFTIDVCDTCFISQINWLSDGIVNSQIDSLVTDDPGSYQVNLTVQNVNGSLSLSDTLYFELVELNSEFTVNACLGQHIALNDFIYPDLLDEIAWQAITEDSVIANSDTIFSSDSTDILGCTVSFSLNLNVLNPGIIDTLVAFCYGENWNVMNYESPSFNGPVNLSWQGSPDSINWTALEVDSLVLNSDAVINFYQYLRRVAIVDSLNCPSSPSQIIQLGDTLTSIDVVEQQTLCPGDTLSLNPAGCQSYYYQGSMNPGSVISEDMEIVIVGSNFFNYSEIIYTCSDTAAVQINVVGFSAGLITGSQLLCANEPIGPFESTDDASSEGELNLQWQQSLDGLNWSDIQGAIGQDYSLNAVAEVSSSFRRLANGIIPLQGTDTLECQSPSNIVFISVPNQAVEILGPVGDVCRNSYYVPVNVNASNCSFDWTITGGSIMANSNQDDEVFLHLETEDSCNVDVQIMHLQSGCEQTLRYTIYVSEHPALDTVPVFVIDQDAHLLGINPNTQADALSWGFSTLDGFDVESDISNLPYCYFPNFNNLNFVYWVDLISGNGCVTRSYLNFNQLETNMQEVFDNPFWGYPNPFEESHQIQNNSAGKLIVSVFDAIGECVEARIINSRESIAIGENLSAGHYVVRLIDGNGHFKAYTIIKM
jgi:PKD repeat protein